MSELASKMKSLEDENARLLKENELLTSEVEKLTAMSESRSKMKESLDYEYARLVKENEAMSKDIETLRARLAAFESATQKEMLMQAPISGLGATEGEPRKSTPPYAHSL